MEIISYVGSSAGSSFRMPEIDFKNIKDNLKSFNASGLLKRISLKHGIRKFVSKIAALSSASRNAGIVLWLSLTLFACIAVPVAVCSFSSYFSSFASPVELDNFDGELAMLDSLMSKFAMEDAGYSFDEEGNIILEDGSVLKASAVSVGQTVTYQTYTVKSGEAISTITRKFGLTNISTLIAVNGIGNVRALREGQKLRIPSMDGLIHRVSKGESLGSVSAKYHVSVEEICDANDLSSQNLKAGQELFIPGAKLDSMSLKKAMGELFVCPITAKYRISSLFGPRIDPISQLKRNHTGVDFACPTGTPIGAAMSGKVVYVGWSNIFGNYVIINHINGYQTLYAHMSKITCKNGQKVDQGTKVGLVGSTGYSTGPHLHFTVYKNGNLVDPLTLIRR